MILNRLTLKKGDTASWPAQTLTQNKSPVGLTGATVTMRLSTTIGGTPKIEAAMTIISASEGRVQYDSPTAGDMDTAGVYYQEIEVVFADGKTQSFPSEGYNQVTIIEDLG